MNPKYRGDSKDLFKRGFLSLVRSFGCIRGPKVLPLFTGEFHSSDVKAYAGLLGINDGDVIVEERFYPKHDRQEYFQSARAPEYLKVDLFLDPDRGLVAELRGDTSDREVITFEEAASLVKDPTDRVIMVYDESINMQDREKATGEKLDAVQGEKWNLSAFAYFNSSPNHPNILFIANESACPRLDEIRKDLIRCGLPKTRLRPEQ